MTEPVPPAGYVRVLAGDAEAITLPEVADAVRDALAEAGSLAAWAAARAERVVTGGRGPLWVTELGGFRVAVRHFRRGGWIAPVLGDRYFGRSARPFAELAVATALRTAGVPTPRILAAVRTPAHPGYRADLATEWLSPGLDLEELLRPGLYPAAEREAAIRVAARLVTRAHAAGLDHPDLRPRNVFLRPLPSGDWEAFLLDLDRARVTAASADVKKKTSIVSADRWRRSGARAA